MVSQESIQLMENIFAMQYGLRLNRVKCNLCTTFEKNKKMKYLLMLKVNLTLKTILVLEKNTIYIYINNSDVNV